MSVVTKAHKQHPPLKIAIIAGEESGDQLGSDLVKHLKEAYGGSIQVIGVGGTKLEKLGLVSFFPAEDIALMGISSVFKKMPSLLKYLKTLPQYIVSEAPDCVVLIDSPEFTHRVAKKIRALAPKIPIIKYIAPSVWAWRPERAKKMVPFIDHILVNLPFEEEVLKQLKGPPATYVGHILSANSALQEVQEYRQKKFGLCKNLPIQEQEQNLSAPCTASSARTKHEEKAPVLLVLPGSRSFEIEYLMPVFGQTVALLKKKNPDLNIILPTLKEKERQVRALAKNWKVAPEIVVGSEEKWSAFKKATIALAASGTVSLELCLCVIPMILAYKMDVFSKIFIKPRIKIWSAALPNIIADAPIVPEFFNEFVRPDVLSHQLNHLLHSPLLQSAQKQGFHKVRQALSTKRPAGQIAAEKLLDLLSERSAK